MVYFDWFVLVGFLSLGSFFLTVKSMENLGRNIDYYSQTFPGVRRVKLAKHRHLYGVIVISARNVWHYSQFN